MSSSKPSSQVDSLNTPPPNEKSGSSSSSSADSDHPKGKSNNHGRSADKLVASVEAPVEQAEHHSPSQLPPSRPREPTPESENAAWILFYMSRGQYVPSKDTTAHASLPVGQLNTPTHSSSAPVPIPVSSSTQHKSSTYDDDSEDTLDYPIKRITYSSHGGRPYDRYKGRHSEYEAEKGDEQDAQQGVRSTLQPSQSYVSGVHSERQLTIPDTDHKHHTSSELSSESQPKTRRSSSIDQHIKRDERESDIAAGFPNGRPKDDAPREEWDRYLYNKVEYFNNKQAERNRHWPQLEAGLKFQRQMSEGVMPGSGEVPPSIAKRNALRSSSKRHASTSVVARSVKGSNAHGDDSDQDGDAKPTGMTQALLRDHAEATTPTSSPAREEEIRNKHDIGDQARTTKRRRVDDLDTNLGEAWDAHVDEKGGRPKRKVHRDT